MLERERESGFLSHFPFVLLQWLSLFHPLPMLQFLDQPPIPLSIPSHPFSLSSPPPDFSSSSDIFAPLPSHLIEASLSNWVNAVIIKIIRHSFEKDYLQKQLRRIWKITGAFSLLSLGHGSFVLQNPSASLREKILNSGPWFINGFLVGVSAWCPGFKPQDYKFSSFPVRVELPDLPPKYIGENLGLFLKSASLFAKENLRNPRILVLLDISSPLPLGIWLEAFYQKLIFLNLPPFCSGCNGIGHLLTTFPLNPSSFAQSSDSILGKPPQSFAINDLSSQLKKSAQGVNASSPLSKTAQTNEKPFSTLTLVRSPHLLQVDPSPPLKKYTALLPTITQLLPLSNLSP